MKLKNKFTNFSRGVVLCLLFTGAVLGVADNSSQAAVFSTNVSPATPTTVYSLLPTNGVKVNQIIIANSISTVPLVVSLYDSATATNVYTNQLYTNYISYATNVLTTNISPFNGFTNIVTNIGQFTLTNIVVASSNNVLPATTYAVSPSQSLVIPVNLLYERGIATTFSTNGTIIINYSQQ